MADDPFIHSASSLREQLVPVGTPNLAPQHAALSTLSTHISSPKRSFPSEPDPETQREESSPSAAKRLKTSHPNAVTTPQSTALQLTEDSISLDLDRLIKSVESADDALKISEEEEEAIYAKMAAWVEKASELSALIVPWTGDVDDGVAEESSRKVGGEAILVGEMLWGTRMETPPTVMAIVDVHMEDTPPPPLALAPPTFLHTPTVVVGGPEDGKLVTVAANAFQPPPPADEPYPPPPTTYYPTAHPPTHLLPFPTLFPHTRETLITASPTGTVHITVRRRPFRSVPIGARITSLHAMTDLRGRGWVLAGDGEGCVTAFGAVEGGWRVRVCSPQGYAPTQDGGSNAVRAAIPLLVSTSPGTLTQYVVVATASPAPVLHVYETDTKVKILEVPAAPVAVCAGFFRDGDGDERRAAGNVDADNVDARHQQLLVAFTDHSLHLMDGFSVHPKPYARLPALVTIIKAFSLPSQQHTSPHHPRSTDYTVLAGHFPQFHIYNSGQCVYTRETEDWVKEVDVRVSDGEGKGSTAYVTALLMNGRVECWAIRVGS
ncbi:uncharacterized protein EV422DRAFT_342694 [Fimicolochytrium jonesii]|uniref:uncharacterized protein n=1 Tax=Fimicolochytrium jonesii TaxID=1396493 RepID=UPI0022FE36C1|nr:uncharacterized protein EV422DRAFT_342694 [Fimicolochytrium jonesii]KAI8815840.1 hypothetical protein EV422DRAFT_342694 [Fimicolochytrium jonesii]